MTSYIHVLSSGIDIGTVSDSTQTIQKSKRQKRYLWFMVYGPLVYGPLVHTALHKGHKILVPTAANFKEQFKKRQRALPTDNEGPSLFHVGATQVQCMHCLAGCYHV